MKRENHGSYKSLNSTKTLRGTKESTVEQEKSDTKRFVFPRCIEATGGRAALVVRKIGFQPCSAIQYCLAHVT